MKKSLLSITAVIFILLFSFNCKNNNNAKKPINYQSDTIDTIVYEEIDTMQYGQFIVIQLDSIEASKYNINMTPGDNYKSLKWSIKSKRNQFYERYSTTPDSLKDAIASEAQEYFYETLLNKIFPYWYGMTWDMSGYSQIPQDGTVGCSYFVTNTLLHAVLKLNRYRLAQCDATTTARSLQTNNDIIIFRNTTTEEFIEYVKNQLPEGIYTLGLPMHIGFLLHRENNVFFIHSSYIDPVTIVIERAEVSRAFWSSFYIIGEITTNKELIKKWIINDTIPLLKNQ